MLIGSSKNGDIRQVDWLHEISMHVIHAIVNTLLLAPK